MTDISPTMHRLLTVMGEVRAKRDDLERQFKEAVAAEALKGCHDDSDTLQAAFHAWNRQMKVELEIANG